MAEVEWLYQEKGHNLIKDLFNLQNKRFIIAGPCSVESRVQMKQVADVLAEYHIPFIRGGAYKPRTSPYSFQGLGLDGLKILDNIRKHYHLFAVSEVVDVRDLETVAIYTDMIQIGSRNMHNYALLNEVGKMQIPVLLKRGMMSTINELLMAAEYILSHGNDKVLLCERGIRTFETSTRNTLDISCIAYVKQETGLPIIADLSHSLGRKDILLPVAKAALAAGADGIMVEAHPNPQNAYSDAMQQLNLDELKTFIENIALFL